MTGTEDPSTSAMISLMLVARPPGVFRRRITASTRRSPAVVSASFTYLAVAGPIAPSISIISAGLPLSSADRSAGEANWKAAAIAATRVACTILTARFPDKTIYGVVFPRLNRTDARVADRRQTSPQAGVDREADAGLYLLSQVLKVSQNLSASKAKRFIREYLSEMNSVSAK